MVRELDEDTMLPQARSYRRHGWLQRFTVSLAKADRTAFCQPPKAPSG
jgi:hypothetical protein